MSSKDFCQDNQALETFRLFEDILNGGSSLRVKVTGRSMAPFLKGGDIVTIKKIPCLSLRRGDLIFFKNTHGVLTLHRVIKKRVNNDIFIFRTKGDAIASFDEPVTESEILGKVCMIEKGAKYINTEARIHRGINYLIALISLLEARIYFALNTIKIFRAEETLRR